MIHLNESVRAWGTPAFAETLKREIEALDPAVLPLQQGMRLGSYALGADFQVTVLGAWRRSGRLEARVGVFYAGLVPGCSCADDPTPVEPHPEYCELIFIVEPDTGEAMVRLAGEDGT